MAVFTPVSEAEAQAFLADHDLGELTALEPIVEGVENTNYRLDTTAGRFVLTLFEGRTDAAALPYCLRLTRRLAAAGFPTPAPVTDRRGQLIGRLNGRAAAVVNWAPGAWLRAPSERDRYRAGQVLALLHLDAQGFAMTRANPVGPDAWTTLAARCDTVATGEERAMLERIRKMLSRAAESWADPNLPRGPIHADYFPDNVLFDGGDIGGVIDFYFACDDAFAYDLAIALSAWGFDAEGRPIRAALRAFQKGYESVRPLSVAEQAALPALGAAAAVRFTLTRLHDRLFHDPANLVTPKDPAPFLRRLDYWAAEQVA
ncbi:MAG: homoserine kinase [Brevundimonas sp.]|uniref:homoserine kinase n=1 Tax=Brevundimonas sp. TaxID=1871086 RepID=UPI0011F84807|nr:homoserine kinase [Brevundimonas sp.]RZJ19356.1 MAG: homoserine kinase [Brevundimonas sp.]